MRQLLSVLLTISLIPFLLKRKIPVGPTLLLTGILAGIGGGLSPDAILFSFTKIFTNQSSLSSVMIVIEVGMLSFLMNSYGVLRRAEESLRILIPNARAIIMLMPAMVGALQVPGGAALSAPFVNALGTEMNLTGAQRANVNVVSRHVLLFLVPFSSSMLIVSDLVPGVSIFRLAMFNFGFVILMQAAGYFLLLRKGKRIEIPSVTFRERLIALRELLLTLSPIYIVILLKILIGIPYSASLLLSMLLVFVLCDKRDFFNRFCRSINRNTAMMIVGVYFFQNIVAGMEGLLNLFRSLIGGQTGWAFLALIAMVSTIFGVSTGLMYLSLGILIPIAASLPYASESARLIALSYTYCWCFIGYYFSPIHLCQLLTDQEIGCTVGERYNNYIPLMVALPMSTVLLYFIYNLIIA